MKLVPYDTFSIQTTLSPEAVAARLAPHVEPVRFVRTSSQHVAFEGRVSPTGFRLRYILSFIRPLFPIAYGRLEPYEQGTRIQVQIAPHPLFILVLTYWLLALSGMVFATETDAVAIMLGLGMVSSWVILLISFWLEDGRTRKRLVELLGDAAAAPG